MADTQTAPAPGPDMAALIGAVRTSSDESRKLAKAEETEMAPVMKKSQDVLESPRPEKPQLAETPKPPKLQEALQENGQKFLVTSMLVAGLVGAFTRGNVTAALSSYGAMNKAFHSGQIEQAEGHYTEWKQSVEQVRDTNQAMLKEYEDALNDRKMSLDELSARMSLIAAKYKDPLMAQAANTQNIAMMGQLYERLHEFNQNYAQNAHQIDIAHEDAVARLKVETDKFAPNLNTAAGIDQLADKLVNAPPEKSEKMMQLLRITHPNAFPQATLEAETLKTMAGQYLAGDKTVFQNLGRGVQGSANIIALRNMVTKMAAEKHLTPQMMATIQAEFQGLISGERTLGNRSATVGMAVDEAKALVPLAIEASNAVPRTSWVPITRAIQAVERGSNDPALRRFVAANNSLINVYARAINPTGATTVSDKEHAREILDTAYDQESYKAVVDQLVKEMEAAQTAPGQVKKEFREGYQGGNETAEPERPVDVPEDLWKYATPEQKQLWQTQQ